MDLCDYCGMNHGDGNEPPLLEWFQAMAMIRRVRSLTHWQAILMRIYISYSYYAQHRRSWRAYLHLERRRQREQLEDELAGRKAPRIFHRI